MLNERVRFQFDFTATTPQSEQHTTKVSLRKFRDTEALLEKLKHYKHSKRISSAYLAYAVGGNSKRIKRGPCIWAVGKVQVYDAGWLEVSALAIKPLMHVYNTALNPFINWG